MAHENKPRQAEKISADCPHCGFTQLESAYAKSTFCRKCGQHYSIEKLLAKEVVSLKGPGFFEKLTKLVTRETHRDVACFACAHKQTVSSVAQSSLCPQCGSYIDLRDFKIAGPFGRSVQTQGEVHILPKGECSAAKVACNSAYIEGKLRGALMATHDVRVRTREKIFGSIETRTLIVEKKCDCECVRPLKAQNAEISGRISARLYCDGQVKILKGGVLEGTLYARSIVVEKGGIFSGELFIGQDAARETEKAEQTNLFGEDGMELKPA
ncbi:MAG: polymer-forming cytoskeletal protein [Chthoniobacteraceae bacterium]